MANDGKQVQLVVSAMDEFSLTLNKLQRDLKDMKGGLADTNQVAKLNSGSFGQFVGILGSFKGALAGGAVALLVRDLFQAGAAMDRLNNSMKAAGGNVADMQFLRAESQRLGLDLLTAGDAYIKLQAAAKGTRLEGVEAQKLFTAMSEASNVFGMSAEQTQGSLTALQQMISKGVVSAEELRGQLSERFPPALGVAARAMGVTTAELGKMMEQGKVLTDDFIPKFARQLSKEFPAGAESLDSATANLNRFKNGMLDLKNSVWEGGLKGITSDLLGWAGGFAKDLAGVNTELTNTVRLMGKLHDNGASWIEAANIARGDVVDGKPLGSEEKAVGMAAAARRAQALLNPASKVAGKAGKVADWRKAMADQADMGPFTEEMINARGDMSFAQQQQMGWSRRNAGTDMMEFQDQFDQGQWARRNAGPDMMEFQDQFDTSAAAAAKEASRQSELQKETEFMAMKASVWDSGYQQSLLQIQTEQDAWMQSWAMQTDSFTVYEQRKLQVEQWASGERSKLAQQEMQTKLRWASSGFQSMGSIAESFYQLSGKKSRVAFEAAKVMKVGETVTNTASAAMGAYNAMAAIPIVGPALGASAAAAAILAGAAQIKTINSQTPDGGSMPSMTLPGGGTYGSGTPGSPVVTQPLGTTGQTQGDVVIVFRSPPIGKWVEEELVDEINRAGSRNVRIEYTGV